MAGTFLLDTNAAIAARNGSGGGVEIISAADAVYLCTPVAGELFFGAYKSARPNENISRVTEFVRRFSVLPCDSTTAERYGRIRFNLRKKGRPIPENDIWIAAIAMEHGLTVLTQDAHFNEVDGLNVLDW